MTDFPTPNNSWDLRGQIALVTGATSGLGWRFATVLARAGAKVALTGRRTERLEELAKRIRGDGQVEMSGCRALTGSGCTRNTWMSQTAV